MKVVVGDTQYDGEYERFMILFNDGDLERLRQTEDGTKRYVVYNPGKYSQEQIEEWMKNHTGE